MSENDHENHKKRFKAEAVADVSSNLFTKDLEKIVSNNVQINSEALNYLHNCQNGVILVHLGCGYFKESSKEQLARLSRKACKRGKELILEGKSSSDVVAQVLSLLENSPLTNAGIGSNLTSDGTVECDASIMDASSAQYGAVGALSCIQNPIQVAKSLMDHQNKGLLSGNRVPPCFLAGEGALKWAVNQGFESVPKECLISARAKRKYDKYSQMLHMPPLCQEPPSDTIGAICLDAKGDIASGVSSGGIILKHPGRVGQAGVFGAGCWAECIGDTSVAVSTTGCGECLIKTTLAKEIAQDLVANDEGIYCLAESLTKKFLGSSFLKPCQNKLAGAIALKFIPKENSCEIGWAHTAQSLCVGYQTAAMKVPKVEFSSQPSHLEGKKAAFQGINLKWNASPSP